MLQAPPPRLQFFDDNGNPLTGGRLYTYLAGTTTPIATYADAAGTTVNANPIILDARGETIVWLESFAYKFVLRDAADVLIWTSDSIVGISNLQAELNFVGPILLGRTTAGSGPIEAITAGTNLTLSAGVLNATGGGPSGGVEQPFNRFANGEFRFARRYVTNVGWSQTIDSNVETRTLDCVSAFGQNSPGVYEITLLDPNSGGIRVEVITEDPSPDPDATYMLVLKIEGLDVSDMAFGTADAADVAISFDFRTSLIDPQNWSGSLRNAAENRSIVFSWVTTTPDVWERVEITIPGDVFGSWPSDNTLSWQVTIDVGCGNNLAAFSTDVWEGANNTRLSSGTRLISQQFGDSFSIRKLQVERGLTPTSFRYEPYALAEMRVARYLPRFSPLGAAFSTVGSAWALTATTVRGTFVFQVEARVAPPTMVTLPGFSAGAGFGAIIGAGSPTPFTTFGMPFGTSSRQVALMEGVTTGSVTIGAPGIIYADNTSAYLLFTGAEL